MTELLAALTVATLFVTFGLFGMLARRGGACPGPRGCDDAVAPSGCGDCGLRREPTESQNV